MPTALITSGPTYEEIDQVRRITNHSTGKLGAEMCAALKDRGYKVILFRGFYAVDQTRLVADNLISFTTTQDLAVKMQQVADELGEIDLVFHAAAVSDFRVGSIKASDSQDRAAGKFPGPETIPSRPGKIDTRAGSFWVEMVPTIKILPQLRDWFPAASIVGWKYEVDGDEAAVWEKARRQVRECRTDACVVNGPAFGSGFGIYRPKDSYERIKPDTPLLVETLLKGLDPDARIVSK